MRSSRIDLGAGEVRFEAQDVVDLGAAPAVDRLVVVADAADVGRAAGDQAQPEILRDVGILVLVDQRVAEAALVVGEHIRVLQEQPQHLEQQIAEVGRVELLEALLVGAIERGPLALGEGEGLPARHLVGREAAVLPAVDQGSQLPRRPAVLVQPLALDHLLDEADLIVGVEDRETGLEADQLGMAAHDLHADGVERAEPRHAFDGAAHEMADALLHLARRLVGEGDGQNLGAPRTARAHDVGDAGGEHAGLAGAGPRQHEHRSVDRLDGGALLWVEIGHIGGRGQPERARGNAALRRSGHGGGGKIGGRALTIRGHHLDL